MASASSNPSAQDEVGYLDFLTSLPPEILLNIVSRLPSKFFLDLVHTSKHFRNFMKLNANLICNEAIRSRFHLQPALLHSETASGWLVPTHQKLVDDEKRYQGNIRTINNHWALFGEPLLDRTPGIKVTAPGPQYLHFLEQGVLQIMSEAEMRVYRYLQARGTRLPPQVPAEPFFEEVVDGKKYFYKLRVTSEWGGQVVEEKFFTFLETCNMALPTGRRWFRELDFLGQNPKPDRLLRELVWFYSIEEVRTDKPDNVCVDCVDLPFGIEDVRIEALEDPWKDWKMLVYSTQSWRSYFESLSGDFSLYLSVISKF